MRLIVIGLLAFLSISPAFAQALNPCVGCVQTLAVKRVTGAASVSNGSATWSYVDSGGSPYTYSSSPSCWASVVSSNTSYVFAAPVQTDVTASSVTFSLQAALKLLTISLGALTVWTNPPAGTSLNITCLGAP